jgi:hypothetical protein
MPTKGPGHSMPIAKTAGERFSSTRFMLTGADPSCGSLAEWPVRRAGKHKTLYVIIRKNTGGRDLDAIEAGRHA